MGKKSQPTTQTVVQKNEIPEWLERAHQSNISRANQLARQPFVPFTGDRVAGLTPDQQAAHNMIRQNIGLGQHLLPAAHGAATAGAEFQPAMVDPAQTAGQDLSPFMNPFTQNVIDRTMGELGRQNTITQQGNNAAAARAGAFGGSRHGVLGAETNRGFADVAANTAAQLNMANHQQALQAAQQDTALRQQAGLANQQAGIQGAGVNLQGAGLLGQLAQQQQQMGMADSLALGAVGDQQQAIRQAELDAIFQEFMREQKHPLERFGLQLAAAGNAPAGAMMTSNQTSTTQGGQRDFGALGLIPSLFGLFM